MRQRDIDFALKLTDLEGWGYDREDFLRFMRMDPDGTLIAEAGSRRVGITTATSYGEVGWIGNVIVKPDDRGRGYGRALVEAAIQYCQDKGADTCWLNAYEHVVPFYESMGFRASGSTVRLTGRARGTLQRQTRMAHVGELEDIADFDRVYFGASRLKLLREFYHDYGDSFIVWRQGDLLGYAVGASYSEGVDIAPWVCRAGEEDVARGLLLHLMAQREGATFGAGVPEENRVAMEMLLSLGFSKVFRTVRMFYGRGSHGIRPEGIFAIGGLEKG